MSYISCWPNAQNWRRYWPGKIVALIAVIQLFISSAILFIQIAIVAIGLVVLGDYAIIRYVMGFVCWFFFFVCWIATFFVTCCNRSSVVCATYVLVQNILAFIFSCVLIDFDRRYITNPCYDYSSIISTISSSYGINYIVGCLTDTTSYAGKNFWPISISLAKGQLAGAVLILVTSLIYVGIYIYVYIRSLYDDGKMQNNQFVSDSQRGQQQSTIYVPTPIRTRNVQVPPPIYTSEPSIDYTPKTIRRNDFNQSVICHRCGTVVYTDERRGQQQTTIYVATSIRTRNAQVPPSIYTAEPSVDYSPRAMRRNDFIQSVICHRCGAVVYTDERF